MKEQSYNYLLPAFLASLLVHALLIYCLFSRRNVPQTSPDEKTFMVEMLPAPAIKKPIPAPPLPKIQPVEKQLVTPPEAGINKAPSKPTRFLSDTDSSTKIEQIRRGDGMEAGTKLAKSNFGNQKSDTPTKKPVNTTPQQETTKPAEPALKDSSNNTSLNKDGEKKLSKGSTPQDDTPLDTSSLFAENTKKNSKSTPTASQTGSTGKKSTGHTGTLDLSPNLALLNQLGKNTRPQPERYEPAPFSRSAGSGARFIGLNGASDFIPGVSDGDITLLNAKADKFAVFVRRVATQVFFNLKQQSWGGLTAHDIQQIQSDAVFRAKLSPSGQLVKVEFLKKSNSRNFDEAVLRSIRSSANDPHPPESAVASDGYINFIFMAKAWSRMGLSRHGAPAENRWLLLKTGLE